MKKIYLTTLTILLLMVNSVMAQDPALGNPSFDPEPLELATPGQMSFVLENQSTAVPTSTNMKLIVAFQNAIPSPPTGDGAAYFTWTYFPSLNSYRGVQNSTIPGFIFGKSINFPVLVLDEPDVEVGDIVGFNANFGDVGAITPPNNTANDAINLTGSIAPLGGLPVELTSFTGRPTEAGNQLKWETASELNNAGFEVEKSSDGRKWEMIAWVEGKGTTQANNNYELLDRVPFFGDNYYRLKQIDFDGAFEYSKIINIPNESSAIEIKVLPNPSPGDVNVTVFNPGKNRMQVTLFDSVGHSIFDSGLLEGSDVWKKQFNLPQKEVYFLQVKIGEEIFTEKILIIDRA